VLLLKLQGAAARDLSHIAGRLLTFSKQKKLEAWLYYVGEVSKRAT